MADKSNPQGNRDDRTTGMADEEIRGVAGDDVDDDFEDAEDLDDEEDAEEGSTF